MAVKRSYVKRGWTVSGYHRAGGRLTRLEDVKSISALKRAVEQTVKSKLVLRVEEMGPAKRGALK